VKLQPTQRYLRQQVLDDLNRKMVFVGGPRQVGKTTLSKSLPGGIAGYLNWDLAEHREAILKRQWPVSNLWVFDEIHKYRSWRGLLKGLYDTRADEQKILVTGSARLDLYRFGGDSLQGRYHFLRLHPFSVAELKIKKQTEFDSLTLLGGFPEPFLSGSEVQAKRWAREYRTRLIREDVVDLERITDLGNLELLMLRLPELVGSPLSVNALREDLQVAFKTAESWITVLERMYSVFRLPPFGAPKLRAVRKEQKLYHFNWSVVPSPGARFENMVASHLLKWVHHQVDTQGRELELRYFRDRDDREVDFVITESRKPILFVEAKLSPGPADKSLLYLCQKFPGVDAVQVSATGTLDHVTDHGIRVCPALTYLATLV